MIMKLYDGIKMNGLHHGRPRLLSSIPLGVKAIYMDNIPKFETIASNDSDRTFLIDVLQAALNKELRKNYRSVKRQSREEIAHYLVKRVGEIVDELNASDYSLGSIDYGGDINFENSYQFFSNKLSPGNRLILHFIGFSCNVHWEE
jgi:hypothetical protein